MHCMGRRQRWHRVSLNPAQITATDIINLFPSNAIVRLRSFRFNQPPVATNPMNQTNNKALNSFVVNVPPDTFTDPDDPVLSLSAQLVNGSTLPSWLTFDPATATFDGFAPASMLNKTLQIEITATDGYLSANSTWELHINANRGPFVAKPIPALTAETSSEFSYAVPAAVFQDLDNNTLTYSAVQEGYDVLPGFLTFDPNTLTFLGRPTVNDVNTYTIQLTATDQFGASAIATMDIRIEYSNWDAFLKGFEDFGIASAIASPFTWAYYNRAFIRNNIKRKSYWRDEIPEDLLKRRGYKPKYPTTGKEIEKKDIVKIQVLAFDKDAWGHDFAKDKLPIPFYVSLCAKPLLNEEPLPTWLELDPDTGTLQLRPDHFPHGNHGYIFQVVGENGYLLESFFIDPSRITMYQAPVNLTEIVSLDLDDVELQPSSASVRSGGAVPDVWADVDLQEILTQRPGAAAEPNRTLSGQETIDVVHLLADDDATAQITLNEGGDQEDPTEAQRRGTWVKPSATKELEEALSKRR